MNRKAVQGFTLLELMVAVTVAAILIVIAIPSFTSSVQQNETITDSNSVLSLITLARGEAIKRDQNVVVCKALTATGTPGQSMQCVTGGTWDQGVAVFHDDNNDGQPQDTELIKAISPLTTASTITGSGTYASLFTVTASGSPTSSSNFYVVPKATSHQNYRRYVSVFSTGRARVCDPSTAIAGSCP